MFYLDNTSGELLKKQDLVGIANLQQNMMIGRRYLKGLLLQVTARFSMQLS